MYTTLPRVTHGGVMLLFDPRPKTKREDLFDRERELEELSKLQPLTLLLAPRRYGKTSILKVFLEDTDLPHIYLDCRGMTSEGSSKKALYMTFQSQVNKLLKKERGILRFLKRVKSLNIMGVGIDLISSGGNSTILEILEKLQEWAESEGKDIIIAFDEAQNLRFFRRRGGVDFPELFAYVYDNFSRIRMVLTGSESGILLDFLDLENPNSPLFGRVIKQVRVLKFRRDQSITFLSEGFKQVKMEVRANIIERATDELDGIVGWLVMFGNTAVLEGNIESETIDVVKEKAVEMVKSELKKLFSLSERYRYILKSVAFGSNSWKSLKEALQVMEGKKVPDGSLARDLKKLVDMGYLSIVYDKRKIYTIDDPILKSAVAR